MLNRRQRPEANGLPREREQPVIYVALGDSTVFGLGASRPERSYVGLLGARLQAIYPLASTVNLGVNGATAADVVALQLAAAIGRRPNLVTLSVGPNDMIQGRSAEQFERDMATIFRRLDEETGAVVVVNLLPDLAALPLLTPELRALAGPLTARFNVALRYAAHGRRAILVDLYEASRRVVPGNPGLLSSDYFHPSDEGYARWAELMWSGIEPMLPE